MDEIDSWANNKLKDIYNHKTPQLLWRLEHCDISLTQLRTLLTHSHTYGISEKGRKEIVRLIKFWVDEKSYKTSELNNLI